jgi:tRNA modification GTPase
VKKGWLGAARETRSKLQKPTLMPETQNDTIFALASARGSAGISVLRMSGPKAKKIAQKLNKNKELNDKQIHLQKLESPKDQRQIDQALVLFFAGPRSFTGEDVVEFHCHGSPAVLDILSDELLALGARGAEPGEFTRRAFENGQMDLVQAEGLADLIDAETKAQQQQAIGQLGGNLSQQIDHWRSLLLAILARVEAEIDFPDEEDVTGSLALAVQPNMQELRGLLQEQLADADRGKQVRSGFLIALVGSVNTGKSTLLNALAGEERAIVSELPGTTRDVIEVQMQIGGFKVSIADTAGLRDTAEPIEKEGVRRTRTTAEKADMRLFLQEFGKTPDETSILPKTGDLTLETKIDLHPHAKPTQTGNRLSLSAQTGVGLDTLLQALETRIVTKLSVTETPGLTRARHVRAVTEADRALHLAEQQLNVLPELAAEHLREAARQLASLLGEVHTEQVLGEIFAGFCIGK